MGTIYKARDLKLDRIVALKVFRGLKLDAREGAQLLLREAKTASALNHPNIVTIYDFGHTEAGDFIAMEWVDGETLADLIPPGGMDLDQVAHMARQIADGLSAAHKRGIIHRDIKPQNLIRNQEGTVKILDFGVARYMEEDTALSGPNTVKGTYFFMSPEQAMGQPIDARSDIFAFGTLLYLMVTGRKPFENQSVEMLVRDICKKTPRLPSDLRADLPAAWDELIMRCLEKEPGHRFFSMAEVAATPSLAAETVTVPSLQSSRRSRLPAFLWVLLLPVFVVAIWLATRPRPTTQTDFQKIAVLPFENISGDPMLQVIADGLTAHLTSALAKPHPSRSDLWVVPVNHIRRLKDRTVEEVYDQFGIDLVVSGNIHFAGASRRLSVDLIRADEERYLHSEVFDVREDRLFSMQKRVTARLFSWLNWEDQPTSETVPNVSGAFLHYLQGLGFLYRYGEDGNVDRAIAEFQAAQALDPDYVPAQLRLCEAWRKKRQPHLLVKAEAAIQRLRTRGEFPGAATIHGWLCMDKGAYQEAIDLFGLAIEADPADTSAHYGLAAVHARLGRPRLAREIYERVVAENPNDWSGRHKLAVFYIRHNWYEEAEAVLRPLCDAVPNNVVCLRSLASTLYYLDRREEALETYDRMLAISPIASGYNNKGAALFYWQRYEEAIAAFEKSVLLDDRAYMHWAGLADAYRWAGFSQDAVAAYGTAIDLVRSRLQHNPNDLAGRIRLALYVAKAGREDDALLELEHLGEAVQRPNFLYQKAIIYELAGDRTKALDYLHRALDGGYPKHEICNEPELKDLRQDPQFLYY